MDRIRLLCAFQVLTVPEASASVTHARAREVVQDLLELDELPAHTPRVQPSLDAYLAAWLGLELVAS